MRPTGLRRDGSGPVAATSGASLWPKQSVPVVADLPLKKASSLARRGRLLPPATPDRGDDLAEVMRSL